MGQHEDFEAAITRELKSAFELLRGLSKKLEVMLTNQSACNVMCTRTLESLARKLEAQEMRALQHGEDIDVLKARVKGGA